MNEVSAYVCGNCGRTMGAMEQPYDVGGGQIVCAACVPYVSLPAAQSTQRRCRVCGSSARPVKRAKGSVVIMIALFLLGVLPGILYALLNNGYEYKCPKCKAKVADA